MVDRRQFIELVGVAPENLEFLGQYYDAGVDSTIKCAVTGQTIRFCFILKPASGKGKITIGTDAFYPFKVHNPEVGIALEAAHTLLITVAHAEKVALERRAELQAKKAALFAKKHRPFARVIAPGVWKVKVGNKKGVEAHSLAEVVVAASNFTK